MKTPIRGNDSLIGPTVVIKGQVKLSQESLTIMGRVDGVIDLDQTLIIHEGGDVTAEVRAQDVQVDGRLKGEIHGIERVSISASGIVEGNIYAKRFSVEEGASLKGRVIMENEGSSLKQSRPAKNPTRATRKGERTPAAAGEEKLPGVANDKTRAQ